MMRVDDIMTEDVACCEPSTRLPEVARLMAECDCGCIPVVEDGGRKRIVGMITDRDIAIRAVAANKDARELTARDCMTPGAVVIASGASVDDCCRVMEDNQVRRIPVTDNDGVCCGIVAQADVALNAPSDEVAEVLRDVSQHGSKNRPATAAR